MKIGIVGGGQLGQMLAQAGQKLGHSFTFLVPPGECCVENLGEVVRSNFNDSASFEKFAHGVDVFTFEWENVPLSTLEALEKFAPVRPSPRCAQVAKDRVLEKQFFQDAGLQVQKFAPVSSTAELVSAITTVGLPAMLKTRGQGYDGKGQRKITDIAMAADAFTQLGNVPCILEQFVPFDFEISIIAVRGKSSPNNLPTTQFYCACRNQHVNGILHLTTAPAAGVTCDALEQAHHCILKMMETLDYEGVLCVEFFVLNTANGQRLVANEMAPRVHNSGHWSIEGAHTSQFTNHINAITRQPLGSTDIQNSSAMINLVGTIAPLINQRNDVHVHIYGKSARTGRKLGHITAVGPKAQQSVESAFNAG